MSDSILQVNLIKNKGGSATGITVDNSNANVTIGNLTATSLAGGTIGSGVTFPAGHILNVQKAVATDTSGSDYEFSASSTTSGVASVTLGTDYSTSVLSSASNKLIVTVTLIVYMGVSNASAEHWRVALAGTGITDYNAGGLPLNNDFGYKRSDYYKTNMSGTILVTPGQNNPTYSITLTKASGSTSIELQWVTWNFMEVQA